MKHIRRALLLLATLAIGMTASGQDVGEKVSRIFDRMEDSTPSELAPIIQELRELGRAAVPEFRKGLTRANPFVRLAAARVLYENDAKEEALQTLLELLKSKDVEARRFSAEVLAATLTGDKDLPARKKQEVVGDLKQQARECDDEMTAVVLWRTHWAITETIDAPRALKRLFEEARRKEVKDECAVALAEMDFARTVRGHLKELAHEPGERGRLARAYVKVEELLRQREDRPARTGNGDYKVLEEIMDLLKVNYHDPSKVQEEKLIESAARGMCAALDPYTTFMDEKAIEQLKREDLEGLYGGIGARVAMRKDRNGNSWLTIVEPIFSGPAYRNGLRSEDRIISIEGEATVNREVDELVRKLRGKPGTAATFKVWRRGWKEEREYSLQREEIHLETTMERMLPGDLGYLKLSTFGEQDVERVEKAIRNLREKDMKALIFDLRGNSGGYLRTACKLAGYFLKRGSLIVTTRAQGEEKERRLVEEEPITEVPMVVLVDDGSASASEILAGCLRDHKRATLVGEKTFGKGSVQDLKYLKTMDERAAVRISIAKWYLPSGQSVEKDILKESGIEPDIKAGAPERDLWKDAEFERLRAGDDLADYLKKYFPKHRALFRDLAEYDGADFSKYPDFDALYASLNTRASKDEIRELLRESVRRTVQDDQGKPLYTDIETDVPLQRAIVEACAKTGIDPARVKEYATFAKLPEKKETTEK